MTRRWTRRNLLKATGAGAVLAPFVPLIDAQAAPPKRLVFFYSSNGTVREKWLPVMQGSEMAISYVLQPLEAYKKDLLVVDGLGYNVCSKGDADGHYGGMNAALTGSPPQRVDGEKTLATGISVDQHIAGTLGSTTRFRSLQCGIRVDQYAATVAALSYGGPKQPIMPENDPAKLFGRVFGDFKPPTGEGGTVDRAADQARLDRKSLIDYVRADLGALQMRLGTAERQKLDAHLQVLRETERALTTAVGAGAAPGCRSPAAPAAAAARGEIPSIGKLQTDILVAALACDLTRVGTIQHGRAGATHVLGWLGPDFAANKNIKGDGTSGIHGLAHNENNPAAREMLATCHQWYASQVAYFVARLKAIPEGAGTMADSTLVVWMNELGTGNHSVKNTPWTLVGSAGGFFRTGRAVSFPGQPHNRLLINICNAMDLPDTRFGDPDFGTGPLVGLS